MFQSFRLRAKIMVAMGASIGVVGAVLTAVNLNAMERLIDEAEKRALDANFGTIANTIVDEGRTAEVLSALVANLPPVQEKLAAGKE